MDMNVDIHNPDVKYAEVRNAELAYTTHGSGDPLIMCIGYALNMDMWSTEVIDKLQEQFNVIVFDYRGMGYSTNSDSSFTISTLADDVSGFLDALKIDKAHVLGWSMGGYVAQMFAINYPEKVNKLVLYATDPGDTITINPSQQIIDILSNPHATPEQLISTLFPDDWLASHPQPWTVMPRPTEPVKPETIGLQYEAVQKWLTPGGGSAGYLAQIEMPVLIICGDDDKVVPPQNSVTLADSISNSKLVKIKDSGHGLMYQDPDIFSEHVISFLKE